METAIVARHAESELSSIGIVNGDPSVHCGLSEHGEEQARALGRALARREVDLYVTSEFERARRTAEIALAGREVPWLMLAELDDIRIGTFEGGSLDLYRRWSHSRPSKEHSPGGGESRVEAARRFAKGFRVVIERPERVILVVTHGLAVRYLLDTIAGETPTQSHALVPCARPFEFTQGELAKALDRLEAWADEPSW